MVEIGEEFCIKIKGKNDPLKTRVIESKEKRLGVNKYVLKIKTLGDELEYARCLVIEVEKLMYVLRGLDENFDSILLL